MKKYFNMYPTTYYLKENEKAALYNTLNGKIIGLSKQQIKILDAALSGVEISSFNGEEQSFLVALENNIIGSISSTIVRIENTYWGNNKYFENLLGGRINIEILQIELTNVCVFDCRFCDEESEDVYRKTGCKRWKAKGEKLSVGEWIDIIKQLSLIGCKRIEILGGEPLIEWELFCQIVKFAKKIGIEEIVLYTTGSLIDNNKLQFLKEQEVRCIIQIVKMEGNKQILGINNNIDYKKILELFSKENINYEVLLLVSRYNENMINGYIEYFRYCNVSFKMDFIYPNPMNNHFSYKYKEFLLEYRNHIIQCTPVSIGVLLLRNPCYYNRIAVSSDGEVYPCILSRTEPYGNYRDNNMIVHLLDDKYKRFKNLNKDKYVACKTCVYRYGCVTCTAVDLSASNKQIKCANCLGAK